MDRAFFELPHGRILIQIDASDPNGQLLLTVEEDIHGQSLLTTISHDLASDMAIALIEISREGKKNGKG